MPRGGKRDGSGRPKGSPNKKSAEVRELLESNSVILMNKAIALATAKKPNIPVLLKLLDKIAPNLTVADIEVGAEISAITHLSDEQLKDIVVQLSKIAITQQIN